MNPEYMSHELHKARSWAISSLLDTPPFCAFAVYPRWKNKKYMDLLEHLNVNLVTSFRRHTFSFLLPGRWHCHDPPSAAK